MVCDKFSFELQDMSGLTGFSKLESNKHVVSSEYTCSFNSRLSLLLQYCYKPNL